jgi:hypothetical protein
VCTFHQRHGDTKLPHCEYVAVKEADEKVQEE